MFGILIAEIRFDERLDRVPVKSFDTLEEAEESLKSYQCELCNAQFWGVGCGYNDYMKLIIEYSLNDDGEIELGDWWDFAELIIEYSLNDDGEIELGDWWDFAEWKTPETDDDEDE